MIFPLISFLLCGCVTPPKSKSSETPQQQAKNEYLRNAQQKNLSVLRTEMVMRGMNINNPIYIRAFKSEMKLELWIQSSYTNEYKLFKIYDVCSKSGTLGPKLKEGDLQTPEGFYDVKEYRLNPNSKYFLSFNIGYPNAYDRAHKRTGSALMIHGSCVSEGCLAMTDQHIAEIYAIVEQNFKYGHETIPVHIFPFYMTEENMRLRHYSRWYNFWEDLKKGYDFFETHRLPPSISVHNKRYVVKTYPQQRYVSAGTP
ncbi:MAG: murein L,D-transpeptidase family protein [Alphaproteobacteria bacterium]